MAPKGSLRTVFFVLGALLALLVANAHADQLSSSTYKVVEANLLGNTYDYAILEAQYDEELYLRNQWSCPCTNATLPCAADASKVGPSLDETGITVIQLTEGVWYNDSILNNYDSHYYAFDLTYDATNPCPELSFEFQTVTGSLSAYIGTRQIPNNAEFSWYHPYYSFSRYSICPSHPDFVYGRYYVLLVNQANSHENIFALRFKVGSSPSCPANPSLLPPTSSVNEPLLSSFPDAEPQTWLENGVGYYGNASSSTNGAYLFYKLLAPAGCVNISVASYRSNLDGETDLFVSVNDPNPIMGGTYEWHCTMDADDYIDASYCNPDESATYTIFYIGMRTWFALDDFVLVATTQHYHPSVPVSSLAFAQSKYDLSVGTFPELDCETEISTCDFFPYINCDVDVYDCCWRFGPQAPVENAHSLWIWSEFDTSINSFYLGIPFDNFAPLKSGKLAWSVFMGWQNVLGNQTTHSSITDFSKCRIKMSGQIEFSNGRRLPSQELSLAPKSLSCELNALKDVETGISSITTEMQTATNLEDLAALQIELNILSWSDAHMGCRDFAASLAISQTTSENIDVYACPWPMFTANWDSDPCCGGSASRTTSCRPDTIQRAQTSFLGSNANAVKNTCAHLSCSNGTIDQWARNDASSRNQCANAFNQVASLENLSQSMAFISDCRVKIEGDDMLGAKCSTDADCFYGKPCSSTTKRCEHTTDDTLQCLVDNIDATAARILFNEWSITERVTATRLKSEFLNRIVDLQCVGPDAIDYRAAYSLELQVESCVDQCQEEGLAPSCFDINDATCVVPPECDGGQTDGACYRIWVPHLADNTACLDAKVCNWYRANDDPCPLVGSNANDCEAACTNTALYGAYACLDCSESSHGKCLEIESITDNATCSLGTCSTNSSIHDATACSQTGSCSISCSTCDYGESACVSQGQCSSIAEFQQFVDGGQSGVCIYPSSWDSSDGVYCSNPSDVLSTIGCSNTSVTNDADCPTESFWYIFPLTSVECISSAGSGCYVSSADAFYPRNQSECDACVDCEWKPYYNWAQGEWTAGEMKSTVWTARKYASQTSLLNTVSYPTLSALLEEAVTKIKSPAFQTDALCRYGTSLPLLESASCDCNPSTSGGSCFSAIKDSNQGVATACPYLESTLETTTSTAIVQENSLDPTQPCSSIQLFYTPAAQYQLPSNAGVTQALFRGTTTNSNWVIKNHRNTTVGQMISGATRFSFAFQVAHPMQLCIVIDSSIPIAKVSSNMVYTFARLNEATGKVMVFEGDDAKKTFLTGTQVCSPITSTGTYFAVAVVPNFETQDSRVSSAQYYVGAAIYALVVLFGLIQAFLLWLDRRKQKILLIKMIFIVAILINAIIRIVYVLLPANAFGKGMDSIQFIVFELPTFLFFSVFTAIAYLWLTVVMKTYYLGRKYVVRKREWQLKKGVVIANCVMYLVFVLFIYLIAIVPTLSKASPCYYGTLDTTNNSATYRIKLAYWIFQLVVSAILSVAFLSAALALLHIVLGLRKNSHSGVSLKSAKRQKKEKRTYTQMWIITTVALVCMIFLLIRSSIFLWAAATGQALNVIVFVLLETIPQAMLLFYVHPFRCFREEGRHTSSSLRTSVNSGMRSMELHRVDSRIKNIQTDFKGHYSSNITTTNAESPATTTRGENGSKDSV